MNHKTRKIKMEELTLKDLFSALQNEMIAKAKYNEVLAHSNFDFMSLDDMYATHQEYY